MHVEPLLAALEGRRDQAPDLVDDRIGHGKAADRGAAAVHHHEGAGAVVGAVEDVGKAQVERAMQAAVGIERLGVDRVEALRRLAVALLELGTEAARPAADGIGGEALEAILRASATARARTRA